MLALVASIHVSNTGPEEKGEDVDGRDKPDHDGRPRIPPSNSSFVQPVHHPITPTSRMRDRVQIRFR